MPAAPQRMCLHSSREHQGQRARHNSHSRIGISKGGRAKATPGTSDTAGSCACQRGGSTALEFSKSNIVGTNVTRARAARHRACGTTAVDMSRISSRHGWHSAPLHVRARERMCLAAFEAIMAWPPPLVCCIVPAFQFIMV